jgi:2'-5' RNA ligase
MASCVGSWPNSDTLSEHWTWRPEWHEERPCLYWYLTFDTGTVTRALGSEIIEAARRASWLDPVPPEWLHLTLCDMGFLDEVPGHVVGQVLQGLEAVLAEVEVPALTLGPLTSLPGAVVLRAEPMGELRQLQNRIRSATEDAIGPGRVLVHRGLFWPHVSLGYVNQTVPAAELRTMVDALGEVRLRLPVDRLVLAAVTRRGGHYQWSVEACPTTFAGTTAPLGGR